MPKGWITVVVTQDRWGAWRLEAPIPPPYKPGVQVIVTYGNPCGARKPEPGPLDQMPMCGLISHHDGDHWSMAPELVKAIDGPLAVVKRDRKIIPLLRGTETRDG